MSSTIKKGEYLQFCSGEYEDVMVSNIFLVNEDISLVKMSLDFLNHMGDDFDTDISVQDAKAVTLIEHYSQRGAPSQFVEWLSLQPELQMIKPLFLEISANTLNQGQRDCTLRLTALNTDEEFTIGVGSGKQNKKNSLKMEM